MYTHLHGLGMRHTAYKRGLRAVEQEQEILLGFMLKHTSKTNHYRTTRKTYTLGYTPRLRIFRRLPPIDPSLSSLTHNAHGKSLTSVDPSTTMQLSKRQSCHQPLNGVYQ